MRPSLSSGRGLLAPVVRLHYLPAGDGAFLSVAPGRLPAGVDLLGEAGHQLGGRVEVQDGTTDAGPEVGEDPLGDGVLVHLEDCVLTHLPEGVPGVLREVVVVVDPNLLAREELLVREASGRAPLPRRRPRALLAQEAPQASEQLLPGERVPVHRVLGLPFAAQEPREVVYEAPVGWEIQIHQDARRAVCARDPVGRVSGGHGRRPAKAAFGAQRETYSYDHGPMILTHATPNDRCRTPGIGCILRERAVPCDCSDLIYDRSDRRRFGFPQPLVICSGL